MTGLFKLFSFSPLWLLHAMGWVLGWVAFLASGVYRRRFLANTRQAGLGLKRWLPAVGAAGQLVAELPRLWMGRPVDVRWEGGECVDAALAAGKGVLFLSPHLGCFEVVPQAYARHYGPQGRPVTVLYRPPRKAWLADLVIASRVQPGVSMAPTTLAGVKQMLKALKRGECVGLLPDQVPPQGQGLWTTFFGQDAYTMTLSARLAIQTGATVLLAWGQRLPWGRGYVVHFTPLPQALAAELPAATAQINLAMEQLILLAPGQYLWGYARYKSPRDGL